MRLQQPIRQYQILIETHPSGLVANRTLQFTGTKQEAQAHLITYLESHRMSAYKAHLQEVA